MTFKVLPQALCVCLRGEGGQITSRLDCSNVIFMVCQQNKYAANKNFKKCSGEISDWYSQIWSYFSSVQIVTKIFAK